MNNEHRTRYTPDKLKNMRYSCSTFMIYLGLDIAWKTPAHHTFLFARDVRKNMDNIFAHFQLPDDISIYIANPAVNDPSMSPPGGSALYILVPVPNTRADIDWSRHKQAPQTLRQSLPGRGPGKHGKWGIAWAFSCS